MTLTLGLYKSPKELTKTIAEQTVVPANIKITDVSSGVMNAGQENELKYASLTAVDFDLYEKFKSIGQESYCPNFKIKIKGYKGEDLSSAKDKKMSISSYEVAFINDKFKQPIGLALVVELSNLKIVKES